MIETNLNMFDTIIIGVMVLSCLVAFFRGLVREILSLVAWVGAAFVTMHYFPQVMEHMKAHFKSDTMAAAATVIGLYIGALVCFGLINWVILKAIKKGGEAGALDNILGFGFGALRGALIVSLAFFLLTIMIADKEHPKWLEESITRPYLEQGATILVNAAPEYLRDLSSLSKKAGDYAKDHANDPDYDARQDAPPNQQYIKEQWQDLKEDGTRDDSL